MKDRKPNRLIKFDYTSGIPYFITICTKSKNEYLGNIKNEQIHLNKFGEIVSEQWLWLEKQYDYVILDEFIVMPNHFHGIICIDSNFHSVGTGRDLSHINSIPKASKKEPNVTPQRKTKIKSLSELIGAFKTTSSKLIHKSGLIEFSWQRSFYDRIIRNEKELDNIRKYIFYNPVKREWKNDEIENLIIQNMGQVTTCP